MITYCVSFLAAMIVAALLTPKLIVWAHRAGTLDIPDARRVHSNPTPRIGGIAIFIAFFLPLIGLAFHINRVSYFLYLADLNVSMLGIGATVIFLLGLYDDLKGADAALKLSLQVAVAMFLWASGFRIELLANPLGDPITLGFWSFPITVFWIVGVINAMNLIDGLDGLAAGVSFVAALVLGTAAFAQGSVLLCLLMVTLSGALLGFLFFNFNPARIFLGDSGSMLIGYILATVSVWTQTKSTTAAALFVPALALGLPFMDTALSFIRRIMRGQSPFRADKEHLHHRLLSLGISHRDAVIVLYLLSAIFGLGAVSLIEHRGSRALISILMVIMVAVIVIRRLSLKGEQKIKEDTTNLRTSFETESIQNSEYLRVQARCIREAKDAHHALQTMCETLLINEILEGELRLYSSGPNGETEFAFWQRNPENSQSISLDKDLAQKIMLEEGGKKIGEVHLLFAYPGSLQTIPSSVKLVDALVDFALSKQAFIHPRSDGHTENAEELDSAVLVSLRNSSDAVSYTR